MDVRNRTRRPAGLLAAAALLVGACTGTPAAPTAPPTTDGPTETAPPTTAATSQPTPGAFEPQNCEIITHSSPPGGSNKISNAIADIAAEIGATPERCLVTVREGGGGAVALSALAEREGDGNVIGVTSFSWVTAPILAGGNLPSVADLPAIAGVSQEEAVVYASNQSGITDLDSLFATAAERRVIQASGGQGSSASLNGYILADVGGVEFELLSLEEIGERIAAMINGTADILIDAPADHLELVENGDMVVIASLDPERTSVYPDVPTAIEQGHDGPYITNRNGIVAPGGISDEARAYWEDVIRQVLESDQWAEFEETEEVTGSFVDSESWGQELSTQFDTLTELLERLGLAGEG